MYIFSIAVFSRVYFNFTALDGLVVSISASHAVGYGLAPRPCGTKIYHKNGINELSAWYAGIRVGVCQYVVVTCTIKISSNQS